LPYCRLGRRVLIDPGDLDWFADQLTKADRKPTNPRKQVAANSTFTVSSPRARQAERDADELGI
jgi:hypothetical protein